jgi:GT2 family glycosyltransferase
MTKLPLSIIIPVFNQWPLTRQCLESLRANTPGDDYEVIVVDNGSTDQTPQDLPLLGRSLFPDRFKHIRSDVNLNFGPGCNLGARKSSGKYLCFLNNDTLLTVGWLNPLLDEFHQEKTLGAAGPLLLYPEIDRIQHLGVTFTPTMKFTHLYHYFPKDHPVVRKRRKLQAITGAALLTPFGVFERICGFHEGYRNGLEDLDYCARVKELGYTVACVSESTVYHFTSQTLGRFDAESANACLFSSRCREVFIPDMHTFSGNDGYVVKLTPWLQPYLVLENEIATSRGLNHKSSDLEELWTNILQEPTWEAGYKRLLHLLTMKKKLQEAYDLLTMELYFIPTIDVLKSMVVIARQIEKDYKYYSEQLKHLEKKYKGTETCRRYLTSRKFAEKLGDLKLTRLFEDFKQQNLSY